MEYLEGLLRRRLFKNNFAPRNDSIFIDTTLLSTYIYKKSVKVVPLGTALSKFLNSRIRWCSAFFQYLKERKRGPIFPFKKFMVDGTALAYPFFNLKKEMGQYWRQQIFWESQCGIIPRLSGIDRFLNVAKLMKRGI